MARRCGPEEISGNIMIRYNFLDEVGDKIDGHKHNFDHTTWIAQGSARVIVRNDEGEILRDKVFPDENDRRHFLVLAGCNHEITALEPGTQAHCIYSHRDPQGRVTLVHTGWNQAYN